MARFSDLPQELRDIIWKFAIRSEGPTAHCLSVCQRGQDDHLVEPQWSIGASIESFGDGPDPQTSGSFRVSAPRCGPDGSFSWVLGNYSTYMEDSALWTTCWDSRNHMIQRFRPYETNRRTSRKEPPGELWFEAATVTAVLQRDDGERQYFTIQPMKDLIILQTLPDSSISLDRNIDDEVCPAIDDLWEYMHLLTMFAWRSQSRIHCYPRNIAIEFDPKWLEQTEKYIRKFDAALYMEVDTLWFIDDRLQLSPEGERPRMSEYNKVFNAMGGRFVEVDLRDVVRKESESWTGWEAFDFVDRLWDIQYLLMNREMSPPDDDRIPYGCQFKVLAWEPL